MLTIQIDDVGVNITLLLQLFKVVHHVVVALVLVGDLKAKFLTFLTARLGVEVRSGRADRRKNANLLIPH